MDARLKDDDAVSLKSQKAELPLYLTRIKVYPRAITGRWRTIKWSVLVVLLGPGGGHPDCEERMTEYSQPQGPRSTSVAAGAWLRR